MTQLMMYLLCVGLVVAGSLSFIAALRIPGKIRTLLACVAASVPVAFGVWLSVSEFWFFLYITLINCSLILIVGYLLIVFRLFI